MLGLIARSGSLAVSAGLVFLLSQRLPQQGWRDAPAKPSSFEGYRDRILTGLDRVRVDLETNGKLLVPVRGTASAMAESDEGQALQLDRRTLPIHPVTD